jgi:NAD(P)-dependent dehydrogenase (short-subunit alcohol dehydrogenase family)
MNRLLEEKVAIVTGGSQGLGLAISSALAIDGAKVLIVSRSEDKCKEAVSRVEEKGGVAAALAMDITVEGAAETIVREASGRFGKLDILVNNAGVLYWKKFLQLTADDWNRSLAVDLSAPFFLTQAAAKTMIDQGYGGSIINITSIHGSVGDPNVVAQCASKFGLSGLTRSTAEALREFDIRVNAIAPGNIEPASGSKRGGSPKDKITQSDIATLAVYLASDLARTLTGVTVDAHGNTRTIIKG